MKLDWLKRWLPFANGVASHDTFSRVFNFNFNRHAVLGLEMLVRRDLFHQGTLLDPGVALQT